MMEFTVPSDPGQVDLARLAAHVQGLEEDLAAARQQHPEALLHMDLLSADWNECRRTPALGIGSFLRRSLDYSLPIPTGPTGPFAACRAGRHETPTFLGA